jgi:ATP-dependent RNA helicase RhlE
MYSNSYRSGAGSRSGSGSSYGSRPSSSGGYRGRSGGGGGYNRRPRQFGNKIDSAKYIRKAMPAPVVDLEEVTVKFADFPLNPRIQQNVASRGYHTPTPIQAKSLNDVLAGKDVIGIANTGTGKTAAFVLPILEKILKNPNERAIIMVPTRELGQQIQNELKLFSTGMAVYSTLCIGGSYIQNQIYQLRRNPHVVIGTPGRLKDLIERKILNMAQFHTVVLDEADRMVDMGFIQDITYLMSLLPAERQSLCFSATLPTQVVKIVQSFLKNPVTVSVRSQDTSANVEQDVIRVESGNKVDILEGLLEKEEFKKVLIFGRTKHGVERLSIHLSQKGFKTAAIHGDKTQQKREQAIRLFKAEVVDILVATDVAARGIDISGITHVINYDEPATYEDYIHRIGRTGRGDQKGIALTFI